MRVDRLSAEAGRRIAAAEAQVAALRALSDLAGLLDLDGTRSRWDVAGELERLLKRHETRGSRSLGPTLNGLLTAYSRSSLPRDQRQIFDLLN